MNDISFVLSGGPTACDARLELRRRTRCDVRCPSRQETTRAAVSRGPKGSTPLNTLLARPSQKLRKLNTALIMVGVLRGSTRRVFRAPTWNRASTRGWNWSDSDPGAAAATAAKSALNTPADETTS